jgi:regulator of cell morphogenesis and NO signaling
MSQTQLDHHTIVNHVTRDWPETLAIFKAYGVETCCGGGRPIGEAAIRAGADPEALLRALRDAIRPAA